MFEPLEDRCLLAVDPTSVGIGSPILVAFHDSSAVAGTTFTPQSTDSAVTATVLSTTHLLEMKVHTVNADGSVGTSGEMDFLLLDSYAPNNIQHIIDLANSGFYNGLTFHRILQDFMIQGGDPVGDGTGGSGPNGAPGKVQDDEFSTDLRFSSSGLLALANSGADTNDCQFFITSDTFYDGDYQYTILGKLVAGDTVRQAVAAVDVVDNGNGEISKPVNPPIIDSVTVVDNTQYGLLMLKASDSAAVGATSTVTVGASNGSSVTLTASDGSSQSSIQASLVSFTPSIYDRPAFFGPIPDITTTMNAPVTVSLPVVEGDAGVALAYNSHVISQTSSLAITATGTGPKDGSATITPSGDILGVYDVIVGVERDGANDDYDSQDIPVFIRPLAPSSLTCTSVVKGGSTSQNNHLTFHVQGATSGLTVAIYVNGGTTPIGTAVTLGRETDVTTNVAVSDGPHTFSVKQIYHYTGTTVGNRTIPGGDLTSDASKDTYSFSVDTPPTAAADLSGLAINKSDASNGSYATFTVIYSNPGDTIRSSTIDGQDILVTGPNGFSQFAALESITPNTDAETLTAVYKFTAPGGKWGTSLKDIYTLTMQAGQVADSHSNSVPVGVLLTFNPNDIIPPSVTVNQAASQADPTNASTINFTVVFSEPVTGFTSADVTLSGTAVGISGTVQIATATVTPIGTDGTSYNVAVSKMVNSGTVVVNIAAGKAFDAAGNPNLASTGTDDIVTYDITPPSVTIDQKKGQEDPTIVSPINFFVEFSEPVSNFTNEDVMLSGTASPTTVTVTGSGATYYLAVSGMAGNGTVIIDIPAGKVADLAGNLNTAATIIDNSVTFESGPSTVTINQAAGQQNPDERVHDPFHRGFQRSGQRFHFQRRGSRRHRDGKTDGHGDRQ